MTEKDVLSALSAIRDPDLQRDIVSLGFVRNLTINDSRVGFDLVLQNPASPTKDQLREEVRKTVADLQGVSSVDVSMKVEVRHQTALTKGSLSGVKNIIAIGSGKGGVGKSTVSVNLAVGLAMYGAAVGLVDADIYGPTIPIMMGSSDKQVGMRGNRIVPVESHGVRFMSMGFLAPGDKPLIWRGPMAHKALEQSLMDVEWGDLDYLFVDMPPGTGDVHLTLVQTVSVAGAVLVSTPQDVGLIISMKTLRMFEQVNVPILGLIENMSYHICSHCGQREEIFGHAMVARESEKRQFPFLGEIPLDARIREFADQGVPIILADPASPSARAYQQIIQKLAAQVTIRSYQSQPVEIEEEPEEGRRTFSV